MRNLAKYSIVLSVSIVVPINPLVVYYLTNSRSTAIYAGMIDLCALAIIVVSLIYLRRGSKAVAVLLVVSLIGAVPALIAGEMLYVYARNAIGNQVLGIKKSQYLDLNPVSVYAPVPNAVGRHESPGNYSVEYLMDALGRKAIGQDPSVRRTLHFFGDSFTFGYGVANDDTALNLLAGKLKGQANVQNYGVGGYGLELMYLRMTEFVEEIEPGDLVVFSPTSIDLHRGWPARSRPCGMLLQAGSPAAFPRVQNGRVDYLEIRDECDFLLEALLLNTTFDFSIGRLYKAWRREADHEAILAAADDIFGQARRLAEERGARFQLLFLPMPVECERRDHALDLSALETPFLSLLQYCPSGRERIDALRFPTDSHWSPVGNAWAADALYQALEAALPAEVSASVAVP